MTRAFSGRRPLSVALIFLLCPGAWAGESRTVAVRLDPALELLGVVELLAGHTEGDTKGFAALDAKETQQAVQRFARWRTAAAPAWAAGPNGAQCPFLTRGDALVRLDMTDLPAFVARDSVPKSFVDCFGGQQGLDEWLDGLRKFSAESGFLDYFNAKKARLGPGVDRLRREVAAADLVGKIERYTGLPFHGTYALRLSSFNKRGSQTNSVVVREDGFYQIISVVGPDAFVDGQPVFDMDEALATGWHELSHGILDPVSDIYRDAVLRRSSVQKTLPWNCYGGWEQCFKENMVRAVMIRLKSKESGRISPKEMEDAKKYPYLAPMLERLKEYEADRTKYPTLAHFYPRLLELFPEGAAPVPPPLRLSGPDDPGPDWLSDASAPFTTAGRREKALALLDIMIDGRAERDPELLLRRAVLRLRGRLLEGALADAGDAARRRPKWAAAYYVEAVAADALGRGRDAAEAIKRAAQACSASAADPALCRNVGARMRRMTAGEVQAEVGLPSAGPDRTVVLGEDPRVELLAVLQMLAEPEAFRVQFASAPPAYAEFGRKAWKTFSPFSGHPAVAAFRRLKKSGLSIETAAGVFTLSSPPELEVLPFEAAAAAHDTDQAFLKDLRDFSRTSGFMAFYRENAPFYADLRAEAEEEARRELRPLSVLKYLRQDRRWNHHIVLTALLPRDLSANALIDDPAGKRSMRIRAAAFGDAGLLDLDDFAASPAHELGHDLLDALTFERQRELADYAVLESKNCTDSWIGCVLEHVDLAVTLRALAAERGEAAYKAQLAMYKEKNYVFLEPLCRRLKEEWEPNPGLKFETFFPRLIAVFREAMPKGSLLPPREPPASPKVPAPAVAALEASGVADPRLELASALIGLAEQPASGPFVAFSTHPAAAMVRKMVQAGQRSLPAQFMLYVSNPPALAAELPVPADYAALAGGPEAVNEFYAAVRDFAARANFAAYYRSRAKAYQDLEKSRSEHLKELSPFGERVVVSSLLPSRYMARLVVFTKPGVSQVWSLLAEDMLAKNGARDPNADIKIGVTTDPRVELLSVLLLLHGRPGDALKPKSPYQKEAERWFAPYASDDAVKRTAALLKLAPQENLPAQFILHLSTPPVMFVQDSIPSSYIDAAGGEDALALYIKALNGFIGRSRFTAFYEAHRADYAAFVAEAEKEAKSSLSPKSIQAYLGAGFRDQYTFVLAPLLSEENARSVSFQRKGRTEEVRLRTSRFTRERGDQFLFDQFGTSMAHDLVHTVTNPMVSRSDSSRAPAGCNDQQESSWSSCVQEHLVFAVTLRVLARERGEQAYRQALVEHVERGFPYLEALCESLKEYEAHRDRFKTFQEFYPRIEALFNAAHPEAAAAPAAPATDSRNRRLKDEGVKDFLEGRFPEAVEALQAALKLSPRDSETLLNLGVVYEKLQRKDEALESYAQAIDFSEPNSARARDIKVSAFSSRASLLFSLGRAAEARRDLQRALDAAPAEWEGRADLERRLAR